MTFTSWQKISILMALPLPNSLTWSCGAGRELRSPFQCLVKTSSSWALNTQSIYNPTPWDIYLTYFSTLYDYSYNYDDSYYYDDSSTALYGKPAIYLYPEEDTNVIVYLDLNGKITQSDLDYQGGWNVFVTVTEDGTTKYSIICNENASIYDYFFWEGAFKYSSLVLPSTGWIVAQENLEAWFNENLNALGLNNYKK